MMKMTTLFNAVITAAMLAIPGVALAQDEDRPPLYVSVDCMKSTAADYSSVEVDIWQPMHQELVNQGKINSWALYWVRYGDRAKCDYYTVTTYRGQEQLNAHPSIPHVFEAVHKNGDFIKAMARTWASRQHVATELWVLVDSTELKEHRFAVVNTMYAEDPDAYERMETEVFKPGHQVNHLNPVPMAEAMLSAHPNRDLEAMHELLGLRDNVRSETWALVAATVAPSAN
jgi:hypothetical protein